MGDARWCPQLSQPLWRKCSDSEDCQLDTPGIVQFNKQFIFSN